MKPSFADGTVHVSPILAPADRNKFGNFLFLERKTIVSVLDHIIQMLFRLDEQRFAGLERLEI